MTGEGGETRTACRNTRRVVTQKNTNYRFDSISRESKRRGEVTSGRRKKEGEEGKRAEWGELSNFPNSE